MNRDEFRVEMGERNLFQRVRKYDCKGEEVKDDRTFSVLKTKHWDDDNLELIFYNKNGKNGKQGRVRVRDLITFCRKFEPCPK